jgi:hypothetical protein
MKIDVEHHVQTELMDPTKQEHVSNVMLLVKLVLVELIIVVVLVQWVLISLDLNVLFLAQIAIMLILTPIPVKFVWKFVKLVLMTGVVFLVSKELSFIMDNVILLVLMVIMPIFLITDVNLVILPV